MKADMKCLVDDGLTTKLEERLGENGRDGITHAMHFCTYSYEVWCEHHYCANRV